jgi:hypothetical protein
MDKRIKEETLKIVDYWDLEEIIKEYYGKEYETVPGEEWSNDSNYKFTIEKGEKIWKADQERLDTFKETGKGEILLRTLLTDMCNNDAIPPGTYLVRVSW